MRKKLAKAIYIPVLIFILVSCDFKNGTQAAIKDTAPKFSRVVLNYNDTNQPGFKKMIFDLDTFYQRQVLMGFNGSPTTNVRTPGQHGLPAWEQAYAIHVGTPLFPCRKTHTDLTSATAYFPQLRSISSRVRPLVSGTRRQTTMNRITQKKA